MERSQVFAQHTAIAAVVSARLWAAGKHICAWASVCGE